MPTNKSTPRSTAPTTAGKAYVRYAKRDGRTRKMAAADAARGKQFFREFGAQMRSTATQVAMKEAEERFTKEFEEIGFAAPGTEEEWTRLAWAVLSEDRALAGCFSYSEIERAAHGYFLRERAREKARATANQKNPPQSAADPRYSVNRLCQFTGMHNTSVNKWAKSTGVPTPSRGQRNFMYSHADAVKLLQHMVDSCDAETARKCELSLSKIARKSE